MHHICIKTYMQNDWSNCIRQFASWIYACWFNQLGHEQSNNQCNEDEVTRVKIFKNFESSLLLVADTRVILGSFLWRLNTWQYDSICLSILLPPSQLGLGFTRIRLWLTIVPIDVHIDHMYGTCTQVQIVVQVYTTRKSC